MLIPQASKITVDCERAFCRSISMYRKKNFMIMLQIADIRSAMSHLLVKNSFDNFYLESAEVLTFAGLSIRGRRNSDWYDNDEAEYFSSEWVYWKEMKPTVFSYIKGNKTPSVLKIFLKADAAAAEALLKDSGIWSKYLEEKPGLALQFRYQKGALSVVSGVSYREFILDKQVELAWDQAVKQYFRHLGIALF